MQRPFGSKRPGKVTHRIPTGRTKRTEVGGLLPFAALARRHSWPNPLPLPRVARALASGRSQIELHGAESMRVQRCAWPSAAAVGSSTVGEVRLDTLNMTTIISVRRTEDNSFVLPFLPSVLPAPVRLPLGGDRPLSAISEPSFHHGPSSRFEGLKYQNQAPVAPTKIPEPGPVLPGSAATNFLHSTWASSKRRLPPSGA